VTPTQLFLVLGGLAAPFPATGWLAVFTAVPVRSVAFVSAMYY
jgi:hypothetical protein